MAADSCRLEGWLIKKKGDYHKSKFFHYDNMRWFKLQEVSGNDHSELALCYFKSQRDKEPRGWIFVKDVTEITDSENSFTVYSPARNMTIEAATPVELTTWLKALIETCPHADVSRVKSTNTRYLGGGSQSKGQYSNKDSSKETDEYKPLDRDTLLSHSSRDTGSQSQKSFDRSISLFSRNADGDKNSFYFASSGATQQAAAAPVRDRAQGHLEHSDTSDCDGERLMSEGETLDQLGGMHHNQQRNQQAQKGNARTDRNSHEHSREHSRDHSREQSRERDQSREDHRVTNRPTGGYGGGDSTTSRLHKHITKDTPPRANTHANNNNTTSNRRNDNAHTNAHHCTQYYSGDDSLVGENPFKNADTGDADQFNSNSSLYAHRGSPSPTRARAELNGDNSGDDNGPSAGIEVTSLATNTAHAAKAKSAIRARHRQRQLQNSHSNTNSDSGGSGNGSDSSDSDQDYTRNSRTVSRKLRTSRDSFDVTDDNDRGGSGTNSKLGSPSRPSSTHNSSGNSLKNAVPAPSAAPPRRAKDAMLYEAQEGGTGGVRQSLDDVLYRRPSTDSTHSNSGSAKDNTTGAHADAKETGGRSLLAQSLLNSSGHHNNNSQTEEDDEEVDFKAEMRRYGSRDSDSGNTGTFSPHSNIHNNTSTNSDAKDSGVGEPNSASSHTSTYSGPPSGSSRPPRFPGGKPPSSSANIYSASAAAVIAGKHAVPSSINTNVGVGGGGAGNAYRRGTSTPPRQATDPGAKVDSNFVDADWDAEDTTITLSKAPQPRNQSSGGGGGAGNRAEAKVAQDDDLHASWDDPEPDYGNNNSSGGGARGRGQDRDAKGSASSGSTVRADPNWLHENFDDN